MHHCKPIRLHPVEQTKEFIPDSEISVLQVVTKHDPKLQGDKNKWTNVESDEENVYKFRIVENCGGGNCLFYTLDEFLHKNEDSFSSNEDDIRKAVVDYITKTDRPTKKVKGRQGKSSKKTTNKYSNWKRFRHHIKINLEDHVNYFKTYQPTDDDIEEQTARDIYKKYMTRSGVYGTSTELLAAAETFGFTATIIAQDYYTKHKYMVYHIDGLKRSNRKPRIYIQFSGHPTTGHFQLLEPLTVIKPENPSPVPSGQYLRKEKDYNNLGHLTIFEQVYKFRPDNNDDDGDDWESYVKRISTFTPSEKFQHLKRTCSNSFEQGKGETRNVSVHSNKMQTSAGSSVMLTKSESILIDTNNDNANDDHPLNSISLVEDHGSNPEKIVTHDIRGFHDRSSKELMEIDDTLLKSIEKTLLSSEEFESILSRYCCKLIEMQNNLMHGIEAIGTDWPGIKVSKVWSHTNFFTNFIRFEPHARKPLSRTNFRTHFVVYNQDSIYLTVETDVETKKRALLLHNVFSLDEGKNYSLENQLDHPVLMRVWWINPTY